MFRAVLATQWKWTRGVLLGATCLTFALPLLSMRAAGRALVESNARELLARIQSFGFFYALSAGLIALLVAALAWSSDHAGRHVYALSLPIERWRFVAMRFGAGAATLAAPILALWLGAMVAIMSVDIPAGLQAHPIALTIRFALALMLAYSVFFAVSSGTKRTAGILIAVLGSFVLFELVREPLGIRYSPLAVLVDFLMNERGMFGVFNSRWMLIDV
jgi:ABC-type transport system involved in multi-copper enzyme maturation permease subunit